MKFIRFLNIVLVIFIFYNPTTLSSDFGLSSEIYDQQFKISGADNLKKQIPKESIKRLDSLGIKEGNWKEISNLNLTKCFNEIIKIVNEKSSIPIKSTFSVIFIILLCAIIQGIRPSINKSNMENILNFIGSLCVCICVVTPVINIINSTSLTIKIASNFILCYAPVMSAIMIASGQTISATSYHTLILTAGKIISNISENFIIPFMSILLGISIIASLSPELKLSSISKSIHKFIKITLKFFSSVFTSILTLQNLVTSSADSMSVNVLKSTIKGCVPVIGSMISNAFNTVNGCIRLLKTGVGAFGIITGGIIFLPLLIECILWIIFLNFSECIGNTLEIKSISLLLKSISNVVSTLLAVLIFSMLILIISSGIILIIGGNR